MLHHIYYLVKMYKLISSFQSNMSLYQTRKKLKVENSQLTPNETMKVLAEKWKILSFEEKLIYEERAKQGLFKEIYL